MATIPEFILKLDKIITDKNLLIPFERAVRSVHAEMTTRIFSKGLNTSGAKMGQYDNSKEIWASDKNLRKKGTHKGKPNEAGKRKTIKTSYYKSYKDLRQQQGVESNFVNIRMTNDLQSDFANAEMSKTSNAIAKATPVKVSELIYQFTLKRDLNAKKKEGMEDKHGEIFKLTKGELDNFYTILRKEINARKAA